MKNQLIIILQNTINYCLDNLLLFLSKNSNNAKTTFKTYTTTQSKL